MKSLLSILQKQYPKECCYCQVGSNSIPAIPLYARSFCKSHVNKRKLIEEEYPYCPS